MALSKTVWILWILLAIPESESGLGDHPHPTETLRNSFVECIDDVSASEEFYDLPKKHLDPPRFWTFTNWENKCVLFKATEFGIVCYIAIGNQSFNLGSQSFLSPLYQAWCLERRCTMVRIWAECVLQRLMHWKLDLQCGHIEVIEPYRGGAY